MSIIEVVKASGQREPFNDHKLVVSLISAGATSTMAEDVRKRIVRELSPGMHTGTIYRRAHALLRRMSQPAAARYSLKQAIMRLGPGGFPFERLVGGILESMNFEVSYDAVLQGRCVTHEVDVIGSRDGVRIGAECKHHSRIGRRSDVKIALYVHARAMDLAKGPAEQRFDRFWLVTNTRFTGDAHKYAACAGLELFDWDMPKGRSLKDAIEQNSIHPLTCLSSLKKHHQRRLLDQGVVLLRTLHDKPELLDSLPMNDAARRGVLEEVESVLATRPVSR